MLIRHATLLDGRTVDIRVDPGRIAEVGAGLAPRPDEEVFDAGFGTVIPGLHDHHLHVYSAAAALDSVRVGPGQVRSRRELADVLAAAKPGDDGWIRAIGYHEAVAGSLDRRALDEIAPDVPVRVQHRSGVLWTLNSAGLARIGMPDHPDGRLRSADPDWSNSLQRRETRIADLSAELTRYGVTGVTDATPGLDVGDVVRLTGMNRRGNLSQRVNCLAPGKRILHDDRLDLTELTEWIATRHAAGGAVAIHCVTAAQLVVTLTALRAVGTHPQDRIEHAAVVPDDSLEEIAALGLTVVTQPNFIAERGDQYRTDVPADEHHELWRLKSLLDAGIPTALSTDAPFGDADPWAAMRAAVHRTTGSGAVLGADERIDAGTALRMFFGTADRPTRPRTVEPGQPADLCVLSAPPDRVLRELSAELVSATIVGGKPVYQKPV
ncbi:amidohydrolase family protein [Mycolicibacterium thermoresistibile]|uniref:Amidohydrolase n=2 Tax=Mycolicibacterium thermoresistibile TaxID=1797 RepID=G7CDF8_MYCT3|nr:amidohydrolase family protein [Mycolicibacterium thermoresistibile]EHI13982.1 amidohydrolase [Mycolicibacterium thermoresistibile ATCC 19527]MCV7187583.1 amidohydrolase family protein [Mycolicibacterium thermoresistibile]GAT17201.1 amidohydrolase [Mycolicibacterium thermoresistibile]SNW16421.1 putative TIM-barrel fold metal-dependent hydrolase [Mycolicibacterium thermoresistibile]